MQITAVTPRPVTVSASQYALPLLCLLTALGGYLRFANLGALGFRWDEDLSGLAVRGILEHGIPLLPSGMIYPRGGALLYLMAASAEWLGFSELALRLPAALFGLALIPLGYAFARALFGVNAGLIVAALLAISQWDVEFSRYARMYAPFTFFYVLTLLWIWRYRVERESLGGGIAAVAFAIVAVSFHQLAYTLVAAFFVPLLLRGPSAWLAARRWLYPLAAGGSVAVFFFAWRALEERLMRLPVQVAAPPPPAETAAAGSGPLGQVPLLAGLLDAAPGLLVALVAAVAVGATAIAIRLSPRALDRALIASLGCFCALQLFNFALLALLALAFAKREGIAAFGRRDVIAAAALLGVVFVAWVAAAAALGLGPSDPALGSTGVKGIVRAALDYPHFFIFWGFAREWPMASAAALVGALWAFDRASRGAAAGALDGTGAASAFVLLTLLVPLVTNGLFDTSYQFFRYNVPLDTLYFTLIALALSRWTDLVPALPARLRGLAPGKAAGTALLALLVLSFDLNPLRGWFVVARDYDSDGPAYRAFGLASYPDFQTTSAFIAEHAAEDDLIITPDSREYYNYLGKVDYWIRSGIYETQTYAEGGRLKDLYVGSPLLMSSEELEAVLAEPDRTKWLAASDESLGTTRAVSDDLKAFIRNSEHRVVYVGRDGATKVYRFD